MSVHDSERIAGLLVPSLRGKQEARRPGDVHLEAEVLAQQGVLEVTALGQNVNWYGRSFGDRAALAPLLRAVDAVPGSDVSASPARTRATSPATSSPR